MTTNPGTDTPPVDRPLTAAAATRYHLDDTRHQPRLTISAFGAG